MEIFLLKFFVDLVCNRNRRKEETDLNFYDGFGQAWPGFYIRGAPRRSDQYGFVKCGLHKIFHVSRRTWKVWIEFFLLSAREMAFLC